MGLVAILAGLGLLIWLAYRGVSVLIVAPAAALLVALPQAPESRRPDRFPEAATAARERVLNRIREGRSLLTPPASWHSPRRRVRHWPCGARLREHRKRCVRCAVPAGR